jgi:hypothetical protein
VTRLLTVVECIAGVDKDGKPVDYYVMQEYYTVCNNKTLDEFVYDLILIKLHEVS